MLRYRRPGGVYRASLYIRLALLAALLVATLVLHIHGTTLLELRVLRIAIVIALVVGTGWLVRHRRDAVGPARRDALRRHAAAKVQESDEPRAREHGGPR